VFPSLPPRIGLYQCFLSAFTTRMEDPAAQADEIGITAARSLAALPQQARQAFLLVSVEEFERDEAAQILDVSEKQELTTLLEQSQQEIGRQIATRRPHHRGRAAHRHGPGKDTEGPRPSRHIDRTHSQGRAEGRRGAKTGLVLADIRLADGSSGLDAVNDILAHSRCRSCSLPPTRRSS